MNFVSTVITSIKLSYCIYRFLYYSSQLLKVIKDERLETQKEFVEKMSEKVAKHGKFIVKHGEDSDVRLVSLNIQCFFDGLVKSERTNEYLESFGKLLNIYPSKKKRCFWLDNLILNEPQWVQNGSDYKVFNYLATPSLAEGRLFLNESQKNKSFVEPMIGRALVNGKIELAQKLLDEGFSWSYLNGGVRQFPVHLYYLFSFGCINNSEKSESAKEFYFKVIFEKHKFEDLQKLNSNDYVLKTVEEIVDEEMRTSNEWESVVPIGGKMWIETKKNGITLRKLFEMLSLQNTLQVQMEMYSSMLEAVKLSKTIEEKVIFENKPKKIKTL